MRADRDKRAIILTAEGARQSAITTAEGQKAAAILSAEGKKQAAILEAEAERQSRILRAEGERAALFLQAQGQAKSIETVFQAIHDGKPDQGLLAYQYLQTLPKIAQGDANKMWIVPSEFSKALEGLASLGGADGEGEVLAGRRALAATAAPAPTADGMDTSGWFESQLPRGRGPARGEDRALEHRRRRAAVPRCRRRRRSRRPRTRSASIGSAELPPEGAAAADPQ